MNREYGYILDIPRAECILQYNSMIIAIHIVDDPYIIDAPILVKVEVINMHILIIQVPFKDFQCLGFLKKFHYSKQIKIITGKAEIIRGLTLSLLTYSSCSNHQKYSKDIFFHD
jgi:hypothetical protein